MRYIGFYNMQVVLNSSVLNLFCRNVGWSWSHGHSPSPQLSPNWVLLPDGNLTTHCTPFSSLLIQFAVSTLPTYTSGCYFTKEIYIYLATIGQWGHTFACVPPFLRDKQGPPTPIVLLNHGLCSPSFCFFFFVSSSEGQVCFNLVDYLKPNFQIPLTGLDGDPLKGSPLFTFLYPPEHFVRLWPF